VGQTASGLVWSMNCEQLRVPKNSLIDANHGADVDQGLRRDRLDVLGGHPLADHALHTGQADPDLVLDQLADRAQAPVAEVVDVVELVALFTGVQPDEVLDRGDDVVLG